MIGKIVLLAIAAAAAALGLYTLRRRQHGWAALFATIASTYAAIALGLL